MKLKGYFIAPLSFTLIKVTFTHLKVKEFPKVKVQLSKSKLIFKKKEEYHLGINNTFQYFNKIKWK